MGLRFHKSFRIMPGVKANISKSGPSVSFGGKGLSFNFGRRGARTTASLPGTGLSYSTQNKKGGAGTLLALVLGIAAASYGLITHLDSTPVQTAYAVVAAPSAAATSPVPRTAVAADDYKISACQAAERAIRKELLSPAKVHLYDCRRSPAAFVVAKDGRTGHVTVRSTLRTVDTGGAAVKRDWTVTLKPDSRAGDYTLLTLQHD